MGRPGACSIKLGLVCILAMGFFWASGRTGGQGGIMPLERLGRAYGVFFFFDLGSFISS